MSEAFTFSGEAARNYDQYLGPFLFEPSSKIVAALLPEFYQGQVLELAAGTGRLTRLLAEQIKAPGQLTATDLNPDMLAVAREKITSPGVTWNVADIQDLPYPDGSFDMVFCQYGLMFLPDKQKGFNEALRVLKPGGQFIFATWESTDRVPILNLIFNQTLLPFFRSGDKSKYLVPFQMHDPVVLESFMRTAGFDAVSVEIRSFPATAPSPAELLNGFVFKHQLGNEIKAQDPEALVPLAEQLDREIGENFGRKPVKCTLTALIGRGTK